MKLVEITKENLNVFFTVHINGTVNRIQPTTLIANLLYILKYISLMSIANDIQYKLP